MVWKSIKPIEWTIEFSPEWHCLPGFGDQKLAHLTIQKIDLRDKPILICSPIFINPTGSSCAQYFTLTNMGGYV
jgi:hypothetical protein